MLILNIIILAAGFVALIKGAGWFVDGSSALARRFHVPGVIIGLTIVAMGTSAPELAVSVSAALQGANGIALGNVTGSDIFNLFCVLGICAMIHEIPVDGGILKRDFLVAASSAVLTLLLAGYGVLFSGGFLQKHMDETAGELGRGEGLTLLACFIIYMIVLIAHAGKSDQEEQAQCLSAGKCLLLIALGLTLIIAGGQAVVNSAKDIAAAMGMSETLVGLTIVAVGTSLPELVTSVVAAGKGETGLAVGNAVGSNIFNLLLILGLSTSIHPVVVNMASVYDLVILVIASVITFIFAMEGRSIKRLEGIVMVLLYAAYVIFAAVR